MSQDVILVVFQHPHTRHQGSFTTASSSCSVGVIYPPSSTDPPIPRTPSTHNPVPRRLSKQYPTRTSSTQLKSRKVLVRRRNTGSSADRPVNAGWVQRRSWRRHTSHLWNPYNSTPRDHSTSETCLTQPDVLLEHSALTSRTQGIDDNCPTLTSTRLRTSSYSTDSRLERQSTSQENRARLPTGSGLASISRRRKEPTCDIGDSDEDRSSIPFQDSTVNSSNMHDLERGPRLPNHSTNRSLPVQQFANDRRPPTQTANGPEISPISSDDTSILGSDTGDHSPEEWGPQHPCYPHLNPHVPLSSPLFLSTRIIRIQRDWMLEGDLAPTFSNLYPEILDPAGVSESEFRRLVESINKELIPAFNPWSLRNILDGCISLLTGWLWEDFGLAGIKERLRRVEDLLEDWNRDLEKNAKEVEEGSIPRALPLRNTGYMSIDIQVPNPQILPLSRE
ncbi:hypothetical protein K3495_g11955 [Podosphaera aphanis]|nr:hypothetical protein K3495_g11955 [Podosphaera aphanis]